MSTWLIISAVVIDFLIGDPIYRLHPVRLIGNLALTLESPIRNLIKDQRIAGLLVAALTLFIATLLTYIITATIFKLSNILGFIVSVFFIYSSIACKDMIKHSRTIYTHLTDENIILARAGTSLIVGRDTVHMTEKEVIRATVESIAENTVDGTLAPLFYSFIGCIFFGVEGGACFAILYRAVNTLDSSFGYKNEHYKDFGMISAKIDDIFNYIPARLSLILISISAIFCGLNSTKAFKIGIRDHSNHASPNSGYSEAAFAGALGLQFGGSTQYDNRIVDRPFLGDNDKDFEISDITRASKLLFDTTLLTTLLITLLLFSIK